MSRYLKIGLLLLAMLLICVYGAWTFVPTSLKSDSMLAHAEVYTCRDSAGEAKKELCYEKNVPKLMDQGLSMERTFVITQRILDLDPNYQSCHVLAHLITSKEVDKDPSKWKDVVMRSPTGICGTGALHGAFQERFRVDALPDASVATLKGMMSGVCDPHDGWDPTLLDRSSCMHGMGHLFLYVTSANVKRSIALCDAIAKLPDHDFRQTCYEGVFMQANQPLEAEDEVLIHSIAASVKDPKTFCPQFPAGLVRDTCFKESWPQVPGSVTTADGYEALCMQTSPAYRHYCATANIYPTMEMLHYDLPVVEALCRAMKDQDFKDSCWARTAEKYIWADDRNTEKAIGVCNDAPSESKSACWNDITNYAQQAWHANSPQTKALCSAMPEPWRSNCGTQTNTTL